MKANEVILGKNLRTFVMELLEKQDKFPKLIDYLISLWTVSEKYKEVNKIDFELIAKIIEEAFETPLRKINWENLKNNLKFNNIAIPNTPEYFQEIKTFNYFERSLTNQILELKEMKGFFGIKNKDWKNLLVENYLNAGTYYLEQENEIDEEVSWYEMQVILSGGKHNE